MQFLERGTVVVERHGQRRQASARDAEEYFDESVTHFLEGHQIERVNGKVLRR